MAHNDGTNETPNVSTNRNGRLSTTQMDRMFSHSTSPLFDPTMITWLSIIETPEDTDYSNRTAMDYMNHIMREEPAYVNNTAPAA